MQIAGIGTRGSGTCGTGRAVLGHALQGQFDCFYIFFCDTNVERKFFFAIVCNLIVVVTNTTVESLR